jgi:CRISPR-associated protein Csd1
MSWLSKLYETYEAGVGLDLPADEKLMPVSHTLQNAHINIVIDGEGNFRRATVINKTQIVLPATESSAGRTNKEEPHPLADKIQYIAKDYPSFGGRKKTYFASYSKLLSQWCNSKQSHPKALAVYNYIVKGRVVKDLVAAKVLYVDENKKLLAYWPFEADKNNPPPLIFKVMPTLPKEKRNNPDIPEIEQGDALVAWTVEIEGEPASNTWDDKSLQQSWIDFDATTSCRPELCIISGVDKPLAVNHPAKLRHTGDKAKIISSNDSSGFTFRGRFTDAEGRQAVGVSFEITQKAHNALRWLISRQGYRNGDQVYVAWAVSGKSIPAPLEDTWSLLGKPVTLLTEAASSISGVDHAVDLGQSFAHKFKKYLAGYRSKFDLNEQIVVLGLDSATPGRMGIIYYQELLASEFFERVEAWHTQFAWPQRHTIEVANSKGGKKPFTKTIWPVSSPAPKTIIEAAYGDILKSNNELRKNLLERILPCIVDGRPISRDILESAIRRASNRNSCEPWEWERNLGVACALYRGYYGRRQDKNQRRTYLMTLEENNRSRDYLYGRLLAIAERIEEIALAVGGENRPTTAARMMQRFADRPSSTWRNIELGLQPYMQRLQSARPGFLTNRKKDLV